ncbi:MAG: hypothetical protein ACREX4_24320 [Gammaproteobacteria bacterium]
MCACHAHKGISHMPATSSTMESLLADYVARQHQRHLNHQQWADACAADWSAVHAAVGSFADEHSTL